MKNKDFKELLQQYRVPQGKRKDILRTIQLGQKDMKKIVPTKTPINVLVKEQLGYISPYLWLTQITFIIMLTLSTINVTEPNVDLQRMLFTLTPMLAFFAGPELIKGAIYGMGELEEVCKNNMAKLIAARLFIIGSVNLLVLSLMVTYLSVQYSIPFTQLIIYGLVPFNIITGIHLLIFHLLKIRSSVIYLSISLCLIVLMKLITELSFFLVVTEAMWIILFVLSSAFMLGELFYCLKLLKKKEVQLQWN
ncbi:hypothetical protein PRVXT_002415 [Proteinivorax tanatarense]|uniref:Uncharacterized protein n=1 Tax=Proteinivorax tanatarense TaxID=1260629 RepID=A0AAU7VKL6_9FIRM